MKRIHNRFLFFLLIAATISCRQPPKLRPPKNDTVKPAFTVFILPYEKFDTALVAFVKKEIHSFYNCAVTELPPAGLPQYAFYEPRRRYKADGLLLLQKNMAGNAGTVVGLTDKDISTQTNNVADWGVFGLGYCPGKACVISTYRLKRASGNMQQFKERLSKVVLHELGHNLGLAHCSADSTCLMNDAHGTIRQVDKERKWLCGHCKKQL